MKNLNQYYSEVGKLESCIIDNAAYFNNIKFKNLCHKNLINHKFISNRHLQVNTVERYI